MSLDGRLLAGVTVFGTVVECGSSARAGEALGISASGVSHAIARLETRVGVRLIERTRQIRARVGQLETLAMPPVMLWQGEFRDPVHLYRLHWHQMFHIELVRHPEQNAVLMFVPPRGRKRRPGQA